MADQKITEGGGMVRGKPPNIFDEQHGDGNLSLGRSGVCKIHLEKVP